MGVAKSGVFIGKRLRLLDRTFAIGAMSVLLLVSCGHLDAIHSSLQRDPVEYISPEASSSQGLSLQDQAFIPTERSPHPGEQVQAIPLLQKDDPILGQVRIHDFDWPMVANTGTYAVYHAQEGKASYYHRPQLLATGEQFDPKVLTAAHKTLPFGTIVRVTRLDTGETVDVTINDRGPYAKGRVIDLSLAAAREIGMIEAGVVDCRLEVLAYPLVETMGPKGNG